MPDVARHGPLLSDDEFFAALDLARPGLLGIPAALAAGPVRLVTLLYPVPAGQSCPFVALEADSSVESTSVRLRFRDGAFLDIDETVV